MAKLSFSAQIAAFAKKVPEAAEAVFKQSVADVVREMQTLTTEGGRMRYKTGFLWSSLMASTSSMPTINARSVPAEGGSYSFDFGQVEAVIAGADYTDTIYVGYTAAYAAYREFGANGKAPDAFVRSAAQNWDAIVSQNAKKVQREFGL